MVYFLGLTVTPLLLLTVFSLTQGKGRGAEFIITP